MVKENRYEFHRREDMIGLTQVPLEKPLDGRH